MGVLGRYTYQLYDSVRSFISIINLSQKSTVVPQCIVCGWAPDSTSSARLRPGHSLTTFKYYLCPF